MDKCREKDSKRMRMEKNMTIRHSKTSDLPRLMEIFDAARGFMAKTGNPKQWVDGYPSEEVIMEDIGKGDSYVVEKDDKVVATFVLREGDDPTYDIIYNGEWLNSEPYATIHRIATSGEAKGIMHTVMQFAKQRHDNIRIDTHEDNKVMRHLIMKEDFKYCGVIRCWSGAERLAYQFSRHK